MLRELMARKTTRQSWSSSTGPHSTVVVPVCTESKLVENRVHLDLTCADVGAEVDRLTRLGARVLASQEQWVTMADPEGNEFDVMLG